MSCGVSPTHRHWAIPVIHGLPRLVSLHNRLKTTVVGLCLVFATLLLTKRSTHFAVRAYKRFAFALKVRCLLISARLMSRSERFIGRNDFNNHPPQFVFMVK